MPREVEHRGHDMNDPQAALPELFGKNLDILCCPECGGGLRIEGASLVCCSCGHRFESEERIAKLFWANDWGPTKQDITDIERSFYEQNPFPNYDDADTVATLSDKARAGIFAQLLDDQVPLSVRMLEAGCGTGQLSNFIASSSRSRTVFGADLSLGSLRLGENFRAANHINNLGFCHMNLFRPAFKPESFDLVVSNGVLHHTSDPYGAFKSIARLVRPRGFIVIGLYNTIGRLPTDLRRVTFRLLGDRLAFLDSRLRGAAGMNAARWRAWFMDQYKNPHESKHTIGEVLRWFDQSGFRFVSSIPKIDGQALGTADKLFEPHPRGGAFDRFLVQARMLLSGGREGGLFVMIGRKAG